MDTSSSMLFPYSKGSKHLQNKLAFSVYTAAALIYLMRKQRDAVGLTLFSDEIEFHSTPRLSSVNAEIMFSKLSELIQPENAHLRKNTNTTQVLHQIAENIHKRSLVIIFSDMLDSQKTEELFSVRFSIFVTTSTRSSFFMSPIIRLNANLSSRTGHTNLWISKVGKPVKFNPWEVKKTLRFNGKGIFRRPESEMRPVPDRPGRGRYQQRF